MQITIAIIIICTGYSMPYAHLLNHMLVLTILIASYNIQHVCVHNHSIVLGPCACCLGKHYRNLSLGRQYLMYN